MTDQLNDLERAELEQLRRENAILRAALEDLEGKRDSGSLPERATRHVSPPDHYKGPP